MDQVTRTGGQGLIVMTQIIYLQHQINTCRFRTNQPLLHCDYNCSINPELPIYAVLTAQHQPLNLYLLIISF